MLSQSRALTRPTHPTCEGAFAHSWIKARQGKARMCVCYQVRCKPVARPVWVGVGAVSRCWMSRRVSTEVGSWAKAGSMAQAWCHGPGIALMLPEPWQHGKASLSCYWKALVEPASAHAVYIRAQGLACELKKHHEMRTCETKLSQ